MKKIIDSVTLCFLAILVVAFMAFVSLLLTSIFFGCTIQLDEVKIIGIENGESSNIAEVLEQYPDCSSLCAYAYEVYCIDDDLSCRTACGFGGGFDDFSDCLIDSEFGSFCDIILNCVSVFESRAEE